MRRLLFVAMVVLASCGTPAPSSCTIEEFCRDDPDQAASVGSLTEMGYRYVGVLNANGLNCNHVLWCK